MVPKTGTVGSAQDCAKAIAEALRIELGNSARAAKTIAKWTGASDRAAKYWLAGTRCPSGRQLILLAMHSDAVLEAFLKLARRDQLGVALDLNAAQVSLDRASSIISELLRNHRPAANPGSEAIVPDAQAAARNHPR
jgi:hypothetical protein